MKKAWFTCTELANERLPELPSTSRNIDNRAIREKWRDGPLARKRAARAAPWEYHVSLLPEAAQAALAMRYAAKAEAKVQKRIARFEDHAEGVLGATAWGWFEALPETLKARARERLAALVAVESLARRAGRGAAMRVVAEERGVSLATLHNWVDLTRGVARADWLPALAPAPRGGGGRETEVDERFWTAFAADYLRLSEPSLRSAYRRTCDIAAAQGWAVPAHKKIERMVKALPPAMVVLARKGRDAAKRLFPAQERDRSGFAAMEAVNVDGHKWDVFCRYPDGSVARPLMVAFQDLYSGMFLAWRMARSENKDVVRLCLGDMIKTYGIPSDCYLDNGRAFASKWLTGGTPNRYRFTKKDDDPDGILTQLGVRIHWTTPYAGQSKPIERGFRDFAQDIAKHPAFEGAYTGNSPDAKPENYGSRAIPIDEFTRIVNEEILKHNARPGRESRVCGGKLSFLHAFEASYAQAPVRMASEEQLRMFLLMAEGVRPRQVDGSIVLMGNRYWHQELLRYRGKRLTVRFDPENVQQDLTVHRQDGTLICVAELIEAVGFADVTAARAHAAARNAYLRATRERLEAERKMSLAQLAALQPKGADYTPPEARVVRPMFGQSKGNLALKPQAESTADEEAFDLNFFRGLRIVKGGSDD